MGTLPRSRTPRPVRWRTSVSRSGSGGAPPRSGHASASGRAARGAQRKPQGSVTPEGGEVGPHAGTRPSRRPETTNTPHPCSARLTAGRRRGCPGFVVAPHPRPARSGRFGAISSPVPCRSVRHRQATDPVSRTAYGADASGDDKIGDCAKRIPIRSPTTDPAGFPAGCVLPGQRDHSSDSRRRCNASGLPGEGSPRHMRLISTYAMGGPSPACAPGGTGIASLGPPRGRRVAPTPVARRHRRLRSQPSSSARRHGHRTGPHVCQTPGSLRLAPAHRCTGSSGGFTARG